MFVGINLGINLRSSVSFSPSALFAAGEPGVWFDPSDVANLDWLVNLFVYSQQFENAFWTKQGTAITVDAALAPDGTNTAEKLTSNASGLVQRNVYQGTTFVIGQTYTFSVRLKAAEVSSAFLSLSSGYGGAQFNLSTGAVSSVLSGTTATATDIGNGWWLCRVTASVGEAGVRASFVFLNNNGASSDIPIGNGIFIWGAQIELGPVATTYQPITTVDAGTLERFPNATLYQDSIGTTLVNTPGQTVGLMLDKSKGLVLGPELRAAGTPSIVGTATAATYNPTTGVGTVTRVDISNQSFVQWTGLTASYSKITITCTSGLSITVREGTYAGSGTTLLPGETLTFYSLAPGGTITITGNVGTSGFTVSSFKEIPGNHAKQATPAARPTYAIEPAGGRRNLLVYSEQFDNASFWPLDNGGAVNPVVTANYGVAPDGTITADRLQLNKTGGTYSRIQQSNGLTVIPSNIYTFSVWMRNNAVGTANVGLRISGNGINCAVTATWQRFSVSLPSAGTDATSQILLFDSIPGNDETADILIWGAQTEIGSTATAYQRVTTQYDVTQAGKPSMSYLYFDGVNDAMATPTITPGTNKAQVFTGVRKVGTNGIIIETSASASANAGAIQTYWGTSFYQMISGGSVPSVILPSASPAPSTDVVSQIMDIPGDIILGRINGTQVGQSTNDQGTGNYLAYPLYLGARTGTSLLFTGHIYSVITRFGPTLPDSTITSTERWVAGKTGFYPPIITGVPTIGVS